MQKHIPPQLRPIVQRYLDSTPCLVIESGAKHAKMRHTQTHDWLPIPSSPSDHRAFKNFEMALRRLATTGHGLVFARKGQPLCAEPVPLEPLP